MSAGLSWAQCLSLAQCWSIRGSVDEKVVMSAGIVKSAGVGVSGWQYAAGVKFRIDQVFAASVASVCGALVDVDYLTQGMAKLPDIGAPAVESQERVGSSIRQQLRYSFKGNLPSAVTRVISPSKLSWIEDTTIDVAAYRAVFTMTPVHYQQFFRCSGEWTLGTVGAPGGPKTLRRIEGNLKVNSPVPFLGGQVERAIVSGLQERLALEPAVLEAWLATQ
jgi:Protein of unknown function (DUF2505)